MPTFRKFNGSDWPSAGIFEKQIDIGSVLPSAFAGGYSSSGGNAMKIPRRHFLHLAAGAAALSGLPRAASAIDYPTRPVRLIVAWPAGSGPDVVARLAGQWLSERFAQQFIVDDRPGASGNIGTEVVVNASPDGYTLLMAVSPNAINSTLYPNLKVNFNRDIAPVASFARTAFVMEVNPTVPARTIPEFIDYAKDNPGKITMASGGNGSTTHVAGELFKVMTGIDMLHVPYRANPLPDLLGGQVQVYFSPIAASIGYIRTGNLQRRSRPCASGGGRKRRQLNDLHRRGRLERAGRPTIRPGALLTNKCPAPLACSKRAPLIRA
jgi:hypothetical protein